MATMIRAKVAVAELTECRAREIVKSVSKKRSAVIVVLPVTKFGESDNGVVDTPIQLTDMQWSCG